MFALALLGPTSAKNAYAEPQDAFDIFAHALQTDRRHVPQAQRIEFPNASGLTTIVLGIQRERNQSVVALVPVLKCGGTDCLGNVLRLTPGETVQAWDLVDIAGPPQILDLARARPLHGGKAAQLARTQRAPALLIKSKESSAGEQRETLTLIALRDTPKMLWQSMVRSASMENGGYETLEFRLVKGADEFLDLMLLQQTLPKKSSQPSTPTPPLTLTFRMNGGMYLRAPD